MKKLLVLFSNDFFVEKINNGYMIYVRDNVYKKNKYNYAKFFYNGTGVTLIDSGYSNLRTVEMQRHVQTNFPLLVEWCDECQ